MSRWVPLGIAVALALPHAALACGGFFCSQDPIDQSAERIVFAVDPADHEVTTHVQISYQGDPMSFAWVVPAPSIPELFLSTDQLFTTLAASTNPSYTLQYEEVGGCEDDRIFSDYSVSSSASPDSGGVYIVDEKVVGPYETVTLQASSSAELLTWLQDNGYDLPDALDPVLAPYVASGQYFVALKLLNGKTVGDLAPLGMKYTADAPSIPIQLTSIAALPDMRLEVYVMGNHRAVPESYLHVQVNDAAIDWFGGAYNYDAVITDAANEAAGQAFATDYSGPNSDFVGFLYSDGRYDLDGLRLAPDAYNWMYGVMSQFTGNSSLQSALRVILPLPASLAAQGVSETDFWNCLACYSAEVDAMPFDAVAATDTLDAMVVQPLRDAESLFTDFEHTTRLTSSLSADEMTVDPTFTFNPDMEQDISNVHTATVRMLCYGAKWTESQREFVLADGRKILLPSEQWLADNGMTEFEYMSSLTSTSAILIEATGSSGDPDVLYDGSEEAQAAVDALNAAYPAPDLVFENEGCGCDASGQLGTGAGALLAAAVVVGRRRTRVARPT